MVEQTLVPTKKYLQTGSHIGAKFKTHGMIKYIFKNRKDGLKVLDVSTIDHKIREAAKMLANYDANSIAVVSRKSYGTVPVKKFARTIGAKFFINRFIPGTFTNPEGSTFFEPKIVIVTDPAVDFQALQESSIIRIPTIGLCSTDSPTKNLDLIIPINNNGRQSLGLFYWLLAKEYLKLKGVIKTDEDFKEKLEDFEYNIEQDKSAKPQKDNRRQSGFRGRKFDNRKSFDRKPRQAPVEKQTEEKVVETKEEVTVKKTEKTKTETPVEKK